MSEKNSKKIAEFLDIKPEDVEEPKQEMANIVDLESSTTHGNEMDKVYVDAMLAYKEIMEKAIDARPREIASLYNAAATMLKIAADSKNAKANVKLKTADLLLKNQKIAVDTDVDIGKSKKEKTNHSFVGNRSDLVKKLKGDK